MFDIAPMELLILGTVAIVVIPPKDLPKALRVAGYWVGKMRGVAQQFRSGFDTMVRESELLEMEKRWKTENERIMREHPPEPALIEAAAPEQLEHHSEDGPPVYVEHPVVAPEPVIEGNVTDHSDPVHSGQGKAAS